MQTLPRYLKIDGHNDLLRDTFSMGVIDTNKVGCEAAKRRKHDAEQRLHKQQKQGTELNSLRTEVAELKTLVMQLLGRSEAK